MRVSTYIAYVGLGLAMAVSASWARQSQMPFMPRATATLASQQDCTNCSSSRIDEALLQRQIAEARQETSVKVRELERRIAEQQRAAWAKQSRDLLQSRREELQKDMSAGSQLVLTEVARAMAQSRMNNRGNFDQLSEHLYAEQAEIAARAQNAAAQAAQLLAQDRDEQEMWPDEGWLGIELSEVTPASSTKLKLPQVRGVIVSEVLPDGPAAQVGLQKDDVIMEFDGHPVDGMLQFSRLVRETPSGRIVPLVVWRDGHKTDLTVQIGNRNQDMDSHFRELAPPHALNFKFSKPEFYLRRTPILGIEAEDVSGQLGSYFHIPSGEGILVREVSPDTPAAKTGLKAGDVIIRVDGKNVKSIADLRDHLKEESDKKSLSLTIVRSGSEMGVTIAIEPLPGAHPARTSSAAL
jgi:C-terminal processing protease CtpA/Prc